MRTGLGCNSCTHPTCAHGQNSNGVSNCVECERGVLVLDQASGPKWKLGCNQCDVIVKIFEDAHKVREKSKASKLSVKFKFCDNHISDSSIEGPTVPGVQRAKDEGGLQRGKVKAPRR